MRSCLVCCSMAFLLMIAWTYMFKNTKISNIPQLVSSHPCDVFMLQLLWSCSSSWCCKRGVSTINRVTDFLKWQLLSNAAFQTPQQISADTQTVCSRLVTKHTDALFPGTENNINVGHKDGERCKNDKTGERGKKSFSKVSAVQQVQF